MPPPKGRPDHSPPQASPPCSTVRRTSLAVGHETGRAVAVSLGAVRRMFRPFRAVVAQSHPVTPCPRRLWPRVHGRRDPRISDEAIVVDTNMITSQAQGMGRVRTGIGSHSIAGGRCPFVLCPPPPSVFHGFAAGWKCRTIK